MSPRAPVSFTYTKVQMCKMRKMKKQGSYRLSEKPRGLGTKIFSVFMSQSQVGEAITEVALIVDMGSICTLPVGI